MKLRNRSARPAGANRWARKKSVVPDTQSHDKLIGELQDSQKLLDEWINNLADVHEHIGEELERLQQINRAWMSRIQDMLSDTPPPIGSTVEETRTIQAAPVSPGVESQEIELAPFERKLVDSFNQEAAQFRRKFSTVPFGAENIGEIFQTGGEPRFAKKEGGIYYLVENDGNTYIVPNPTSRMSIEYVKSEGLGHLFDVQNCELEDPSLVDLLRPARVAESGGRWMVVQKGQLRGRR